MRLGNLGHWRWGAGLMATVLVTGGAGFVGSHVIPGLKRRGHRVVVFDNLHRGHRSTLDQLEVEFVLGDLNNSEDLRRLFLGTRFDAILHFAALAYVGESMLSPDIYYRVNTAGTLNLLQQSLAATEGQLPPVVFSSSCAVFGIPEQLPLDECSPKCPISPYGRSKLVAEWLLEDFGRAYGLRSVVLRYFNAAGADLAHGLGERHHPETHLIPLAIAAARGDAPLHLFGTDLDTPDGSAIRDFIHVCDLAEAHLLALDHLLAGGDSDDFNLGSGSGISVLELVHAVEMELQSAVPVHQAPSRPGDPAALVSDSRKAVAVLGWQPHYSSLQRIVSDAAAWDQRQRLVICRELSHVTN
jgi:UDP-glucose 4-epimerase